MHRSLAVALLLVTGCSTAPSTGSTAARGLRVQQITEGLDGPSTVVAVSLVDSHGLSATRTELLVTVERPDGGRDEVARAPAELEPWRRTPSRRARVATAAFRLAEPLPEGARFELVVPRGGNGRVAER